MILSNGSRQVLGGVTYRFVIVAPSMIVLQVQILAVHFDHQHVGLGKTLVYFLHNAIANSTLGQEHLRMQWLYPRAGRQ